MIKALKKDIVWVDADTDIRFYRVVVNNDTDELQLEFEGWSFGDFEKELQSALFDQALKFQKFKEVLGY